MDARLLELFDWVGKCYPNDGFTIEEASADASFRRYFRVFFDNEETLIAMDAPPEKESITEFVDVNQRLEAVDVNVPRLHHVNQTNGFILMEDLGGEDYQPHLTESMADTLYEDAFDTLIRIQQANTVGLPLYDADFLRSEMELFPEWNLKVNRGRKVTSEERKLLDSTFDFLIESALHQPQGFVHRDFHSRNLMVTEKNNPGVIDFQDAMHGPITYDLVSLLRDAYIQWPEDRVNDWMEVYRVKSQQAGLHDMDNKHFKRAFDLMGLQRHIKIAGIFARLFHRDGKDKYLDDLPLTLSYIKTVAAQYEELREFSDWVHQL